ncbi:hypothetical protein J4220_00365 [Candidatus Micrarchaeota archaeon]|nr:hypothetical protein [Candidatus Micrarchaeota archaeon]
MNPLSKFYFAIEDRYYAFCDWLDKSGIKVYDFFVNPIENRGVPSFPFFILLLAIIIGGIAFALSGAQIQLPFGNTIATDVTVLSGSNEPLSGAKVTLTLDDGTEFTEITKNGIAHFEGLPKDATAQLKVQHPSGKYEKKIVLTGAKVIAMLSPTKKTFKAVVATNDGNPVPDALITFSDPDTGGLQQYNTDALGEAEIIYSTESAIFRMRVSADGFQTESKNCIPSQRECLIPLKAASVKQEVKGSVAATAKDEQGNPIADAFVSLYNADGYSQPITGGYTDEQGTAFFQESVAVGTNVYVNVEHDDFAPYRGAEKNDIQSVRGDRNTEFAVALKKKTAGILPVDYSTVGVQVVDESGNAIENAQVKLFLFEKPFKVLDDGTTDASGAIEFEVSKSQNFYATAFADGFLPKASRQLRAGDVTKITLSQAVSGNNGDLEVTVRNADNEIVAGASVELISQDGFNLGYPPAESGSDGIAAFTEVESDALIRAHAVHGSQSGDSDVFSVQAGETASAQVALDRNFALILARAQDYSQSQQAFVTNATITAHYKEQAIASCKTPENGSYCNITVYANVPVVLKAQASGFAETQTEQLTLSTGQALSKTILLLPSNLAADLQVLNFALYKMDSTGSVVLDADHPATELERGGWYEASLTVSFPQAQKTGFYLRAGDNPNTADEKAFIASFDLPPQEDNAEVDFGTTFNPDNTCIQESQQQGGSEKKWVSIAYPAGKVGVKTLAAKIRIRPTAITNEKIDFHYRAFAVKNGLWARVPEDVDLGTKENVPSKESCFAATTQAEFPVGQGFQKCTGKGCITLALKSGNTTTSRFLSVEFGTQVLLEAKVKSFAPDSIENPIVRFSTASPKLEIERQLHQPELTDGEAIVSTAANARAPGNYMPVKAEFADDNGLIASADAVLEFTGTGQVIITVTPQMVEANLPPGDPEFQPIRATVLTAQGRPVENAVVSIEESGETHPFLGFPNGGNSITGTGQQDAGKNGVYAFKNVYPKTIGTFVVAADAGSEFAKAQSREVQVVASNFLSVDPTDVFITGSNACTSGVRLVLSKNIPVQAQVYYQVSGGSNESQCVEVLQPPQSPFAMKKGKAGVPETTQVIVKPILNADCSLAFNSVLQGSGSAGFAQTNFVVDCSNLEATPTPTPTPSACSQSNCAACSETQCINLQNQGFCKTVYANANQVSTVISVEDIGGRKFTPQNLVITKSQALQRITWKNNGVEDHTIVVVGMESTIPESRIKPGESFAVVGNTQWKEGVTEYYDKLHPEVKGTITIIADSTGGKQFLRCEQKTVTPPSNKTTDFCSAQLVDLGSLFASRLGYTSAQRIFNPSRNDRALAASATNKIVRVPYPPYFQAYGSYYSEEDKEGCKEAQGGLNCEKKISPLVPSNGLAISFKNALGVDTRIATNRDNSTCFSVKKIENTGLAKAGSILQSTITDAFGLPGTQYATIVVMFEPDKPGCVSYAHNFTSGETQIIPKNGLNEFKLTLEDTRQPGVRYTVSLKIEGTNSKFALASAPRLQETILNSLYTRTANPVEPFVVANNLQFGQVKIGSSSVNAKSADGMALGFDSKGYGFKIAESTQAKNVTLKADAVEANAPFDVIGNSKPLDEKTPEGSCTGKDFCFAGDEKALESDLKAQVGEDFNKILRNMDSVSFTQAYDYDKQMLELAMTSALQDYFTGLASYAACKTLGRDPVNDLVQRCQASRFTPQQPSLNMGDAFSSGFLAATCDSEVLNLARGAAQGAVGVQGGYMQVLARRLVSQYISPGQAPVQINQKIFRSLDTYVNVPVKIAGENGGFVIYSFKPSKNVGLSYGSVVPDDVLLSSQGFGQPCTVGIQNTCPYPMECRPSAYGSQLGIQQGFGGLGGTGSFGTQGAGVMPQQWQGLQGQCVSGASYYTPYPSFKPVDQTSQGNAFAASGIPFLQSQAQRAKLAGDDAKPNLFSMNKYGFEASVDNAGFESLQSVADASTQTWLKQFVFTQGTEGNNAAWEKLISDAIKTQAGFDEKTVKVVFTTGEGNSISIRAIAPQAPEQNGQSGSSTTVTQPPTQTTSTQTTPQGYESFAYPSQELPPSEFTKESKDAKTATTPTYEVTVTLNTNDFVEQKPTVVAAYQADAAARATSLAAVLTYLLDESVKLEGCTLTSVTATDITAIPDTCTLAKQKPPEEKKTEGEVKTEGAKKWIAKRLDSNAQVFTMAQVEGQDKMEAVWSKNYVETVLNNLEGFKSPAFVSTTVATIDSQRESPPLCSSNNIFSTVLGDSVVTFYGIQKSSSQKSGEFESIEKLKASEKQVFDVTPKNVYYFKAYYKEAAGQAKYDCYLVYEEGTKVILTPSGGSTQQGTTVQKPLSPAQTKTPPKANVKPPYKTTKPTCTQARTGYTCNNKINCDTSKQILTGYCPEDENIVCCKPKTTPSASCKAKGGVCMSPCSTETIPGDNLCPTRGALVSVCCKLKTLQSGQTCSDITVNGCSSYNGCTVKNLPVYSETKGSCTLGYHSADCIGKLQNQCKTTTGCVWMPEVESTKPQCTRS